MQSYPIFDNGVSSFLILKVKDTKILSTKIADFLSCFKLCYSAPFRHMDFFFNLDHNIFIHFHPVYVHCLFFHEFSFCDIQNVSNKCKNFCFGFMFICLILKWEQRMFHNNIQMHSKCFANFHIHNYMLYKKRIKRTSKGSCFSMNHLIYVWVYEHIIFHCK